MLAVDEQNRFNGERLSDHWRRGTRDPGDKSSPDLRPFEMLPPDEQTYNLNAIAGIPEMLRAAGLAIYRVIPAPEVTAPPGSNGTTPSS